MNNTKEDNNQKEMQKISIGGRKETVIMPLMLLFSVLVMPLLCWGISMAWGTAGVLNYVVSHCDIDIIGEQIHLDLDAATAFLSMCLLPAVGTISLLLTGWLLGGTLLKIYASKEFLSKIRPLFILIRLTNYCVLIPAVISPILCIFQLDSLPWILCALFSILFLTAPFYYLVTSFFFFSSIYLMLKKEYQSGKLSLLFACIALLLCGFFPIFANTVLLLFCLILTAPVLVFILYFIARNHEGKRSWHLLVFSLSPAVFIFLAAVNHFIDNCSGIFLSFAIIFLLIDCVLLLKPAFCFCLAYIKNGFESVARAIFSGVFCLIVAVSVLLKIFFVYLLGCSAVSLPHIHCDIEPSFYDIRPSRPGAKNEKHCCLCGEFIQRCSICKKSKEDIFAEEHEHRKAKTQSKWKDYYKYERTLGYIGNMTSVHCSWCGSWESGDCFTCEKSSVKIFMETHHCIVNGKGRAFCVSSGSTRFAHHWDAETGKPIAVCKKNGCYGFVLASDKEQKCPNCGNKIIPSHHRRSHIYFDAEAW